MLISNAIFLTLYAVSIVFMLSLGHEAQRDLTTFKKDVKQDRGRTVYKDQVSKELSATKNKAKNIKGSTFCS